MRQHVLRNGRSNVAGRVYLVTAVTLKRRRWFLDHRLATAASQTLAAPSLWRRADLLAWVLMPDHWHGVVQLRSGGSISDCMLRMKSAVARRTNRVSGRVGALWYAGFHDRQLQVGVAVVAAAHYVVMNPVRAGLVARIGDYPYWDSVWIGVWGQPVHS
jgi:putative transposase